ncbi:polyprenyl synthetase family protein [Salipaludibacillus daqingensis]|uniref:polyprenyl synthetase family protein n=1 Tax=Salipaludibacillus daqingensis TaxID=3041001 RepID=UPI00247443EE|nr:farnesyl diphosphate synthase [Salipaludibacillus daqingensis]
MSVQPILDKFIEDEKKQIDRLLPNFINELKAPASLKEAMIYSLEAGGKRVRPILLLATLKGFRQPLTNGYDVACALEMIHTYSLIHDDLPAMDDDDLRRGKPTNHKVFGEALAILAGDGLLTYSFQLIAGLDYLSADKKVSVIGKIAAASGPTGMVGGQVEDMEGEDQLLDVEQLQHIHHRKTGDLLSVALECGAILSSATKTETKELKLFGKHLGIAFQIKDDLLDVEGDEDKIGKPVGSDETNNKTTYPKVLGMEGAKEKLSFHLSSAKNHLNNVEIDKDILLGLVDYIGSRTS